MITTLLCLALGAADGWTDVKANGFVFEMPAKPELKNGPITWPTTGQMTVTEWTSKVATGDKQIDIVACYESTTPSQRMMGLMHDQLCKEDAPGQLRWDRIDAASLAKTCLRVTDGPDGKRRVLSKILEVGANVCALTSSAKIDKVTDEASPTMRRFVDSLKATGKPTVLSLTPWVVMKGTGFTFQMPQKADPKTTDVSDPKLGKHKQTKWSFQMGDEGLAVTCFVGPTAKAMDAMMGSACDLPNEKPVRTKLPNGATECTTAGPHAALMRFFPLGAQTCMISATSATPELSVDARRFVESFARAK